MKNNQLQFQSISITAGIARLHHQVWYGGCSKLAAAASQLVLLGGIIQYQSSHMIGTYDTTFAIVHTTALVPKPYVLIIVDH